MIGKWITVNGEGIYGSMPLAPYSQEDIYFTQNKKTGVQYAFLLRDDAEGKLPATVILKNISVPKGAKISILGTSSNLKWHADAGGITIEIPSRYQAGPPGDIALCFAIKR
jgi:alpha-L-fucosidase